MYIQWFPGHMTKAVRMMKDNVAICDALIYVVDSRAVLSSINPVLEELTLGKPVLYVFNKSDLVQDRELKDWCARFDMEGRRYVTTVGTVAEQKHIIEGIKSLVAPMLLKYSQKGATKSIRVMVIGVPNSGKSTLINSMRKKASAQTGDRPGVTKGKQWLSLDKQIDLLDTPGTLWGKFENQEIARHLAYIGSIKDDVLDVEGLAVEFINEFKEKAPSAFLDRYGVDIANIDAHEAFLKIAEKRGFKIKGGEIDYNRCAKTILDDFRKGKLGKIMLEKAFDDKEEKGRLVIKRKESETIPLDK